MGKKYPVKVDLSLFFDDERKCSICCVNPQWKTVADLQQRIQNLFKLETDINLLTSDGFFIPPEEPISVVKYFELIKAFVQKGKKSKPVKSTHNEVLFQKPLPIKSLTNIGSETNKKKRKFNSLCDEFTTSTPRQTKRTKSTEKGNQNDIQNKPNESHIIVEQQADEVVQNQSKDLMVKTKTKKQKKKSKTALKASKTDESRNQSHIHFSDSCDVVTQNSNLNEVMSNSLEVEESRKTKRALKFIFKCDLDNVSFYTPRIFKMKRDSNVKSPIEIREDILLSPANLSTFSDVSKKTFTAPKSLPFRNISDNAQKSLTFSDDVSKTADTVQILSEKCVKKPEQKVEKLESPIKGITCKSTEDKFNVSKSNSDIQEKSDCRDMNESKANISKESTATEGTIIDLSESDYGKEASGGLDLKNLKGEDILQFCTKLQDLPKIGDCVLFKLMFPMFGSVSEISDFVIGQCEVVNKRTKSIQLQLLGGDSRAEEFTSNGQKDVENSTENDLLTVKFNEMIEPHIFKIN